MKMYCYLSYNKLSATLLDVLPNFISTKTPCQLQVEFSAIEKQITTSHDMLAYLSVTFILVISIFSRFIDFLPAYFQMIKNFYLFF